MPVENIFYSMVSLKKNDRQDDKIQGFLPCKWIISQILLQIQDNILLSFVLSPSQAL